MTEEQIKEMLNGIINNDEKWEYRWCTADGWSSWKDYKLGYEIYDNYEYRKVDVWYVLEDDRYDNNFLLQNYKGDPIYNPIRFVGTKEACEKFIQDHTKKTWMEERKSCLSVSFGKKNINCYEAGATEICKKILEEMENRALSGVGATTLRNIFKDLGVEL